MVWVSVVHKQRCPKSVRGTWTVAVVGAVTPKQVDVPRLERNGVLLGSALRFALHPLAIEGILHDEFVGDVHQRRAPQRSPVRKDDQLTRLSGSGFRNEERDKHGDDGGVVMECERGRLPFGPCKHPQARLDLFGLGDFSRTPGRGKTDQRGTHPRIGDQAVGRCAALIGRIDDAEVVLPVARQVRLDVGAGFPQPVFGDDTFKADESRAINAVPGPCMILAGSGMCNAGRILHHLKESLWRPETSVVIVGFQAEGTLGRLLVDRRPQVKIFGEPIAVKAQIHTLNGFSAHAGQTDLLHWFEPLAAAKPRVFLTHGEAKGREPLTAIIGQRFGIKPELPEFGQQVEFA